MSLERYVEIAPIHIDQSRNLTLKSVIRIVAEGISKQLAATTVRLIASTKNWARRTLPRFQMV